MHTREFFDLAITLTETHHLMEQVGKAISEECLQAYWTASRARFDAWGHGLRAFREQLLAEDPQCWKRWNSLVEEILLSEMPTRVWTTVLEELDQIRGIEEYGPVARSVFEGHLEARARTLQLIVLGCEQGAEAAGRLNQLRMQAERWTDLLLAHFSLDGPAGWLCFDGERWRTWGRMEAGHRMGPLALVRLAAITAFGETSEVAAERVPFYDQMHAATLAMWGPELFSATGPRISAYQARLLSLTQDTQGLLANWLDESRDNDSADHRPNQPNRFQTY
jgi:hypothetical protein